MFNRLPPAENPPPLGPHCTCPDPLPSDRLNRIDPEITVGAYVPPSRVRLLVLGSPLPCSATSVPPATVVGPLYVLVAVNSRVAPPVLVSPPVPVEFEITPESV